MSTRAQGALPRSILAVVLACVLSGTACRESTAPVVPTEQLVRAGVIHPFRAVSGREVLFSITLQNVTDHSVSLQLSGDTTHYDVCISKLDGSNRACAVNAPPRASSRATITLAPGAFLVRNVRWIPVDSRGQPLVRGVYLVTGFLYGLVDARDTNGSGEDRIESTPSEIELVDFGM